MPAFVPYERPRRDFGFHFADQVAREARTLAATNGVTATSYTIHSTINVPLQRGVEEALQEGLSRYERNSGRVHFQGPEANLSSAVARLEGEPWALDKRPAWQRAVANARLPLYDLHWTPAIVLETGGAGRSALRVGLSDGRILPLAGDAGPIRRTIKPYDVIFVRLSEGRSRSSVHAELRVRPEVQGAVIVLDNKTGRIFAMTGGFSYPLSQLNRATQAQRQPGSAIKPLSYLAALKNGLEPNTLIRDEPITFPPIGGHGESWSPKNYEGV
jgi:penicillin-binding protein 1A